MRAVMLFLLIVLHSGVSFIVIEVDTWFYYDSSNHILFDGVLGFIHAIRIPSFFIVSGYLIEQMLHNRSKRKVLSKRFRRIFIPLMIVVFTLCPIVNGLFALLNGFPNGFSFSTMFPRGEYIHFLFNTSYVWFLYYLFLYNIFHVLLYKLKALPFIVNINIVWRICALLLVISGVLILYEKEALYGDYGLIPAMYSLGGYFLFYLFGVSIRLQNDDLLKIRSFAPHFLFIGATCISVYFILKYREMLNPSHTFQLPIAIVYTLSSVFLALSFIGFTLSFYTKQNKWVKYISDASYFIYLIHFPILLCFLWLLSSVNLNPFLKFLLILCPTLALCLLMNRLWLKIWEGSPPI